MRFATWESGGRVSAGGPGAWSGSPLPQLLVGTGGDPADTIDPQVAGVLGPMTPETIASLRRALIDALSRDAQREPPPTRD